MIFVYILIGLIVLFAVFETIAALYFFKLAVVPRPFDFETAAKDPKDGRDYTDDLEMLHTAQAYLKDRRPETVELLSRDGLKLKAVYYHAEQPKGVTVIMMHGYNHTGMGQFGFYCMFYLKNGCDVLLTDQRACGKSEGRYITFGVRESEDCADWCYRINEEYKPEHIVLHGISLGGATVMMALSEQLPKNVEGVIEDCGFTSPYEQLKHNVEQMKIPPFLVMPVTDLYCKLKAGYGFKDKSSLDGIKQNKRPLLVIHGDKDDFVPTEMGRRIYEAADCDKELVITENTTHADSFRNHRGQCEEACLRLVTKATGVDVTGTAL